MNDGSSDGTGYLAKEAGAFVVRHDVNRGYDQTLNSGLYMLINLVMSML